MPNMRRGLAPGASGDDDSRDPAKAGNIESRRGSARETPTPRRKHRRSSGRLAICGTVIGLYYDLIRMRASGAERF